MLNGPDGMSAGESFNEERAQLHLKQAFSLRHSMALVHRSFAILAEEHFPAQLTGRKWTFAAW